MLPGGGGGGGGEGGDDVSIVYPTYVQTSTCHAILNVCMLHVVCTLKFEVPGLLMKSHPSFMHVHTTIRTHLPCT